MKDRQDILAALEKLKAENESLRERLRMSLDREKILENEVRAHYGLDPQPSAPKCWRCDNGRVDTGRMGITAQCYVCDGSGTPPARGKTSGEPAQASVISQNVTGNGNLVRSDGDLTSRAPEGPIEPRLLSTSTKMGVVRKTYSIHSPDDLVTLVHEQDEGSESWSVRIGDYDLSIYDDPNEVLEDAKAIERLLISERSRARREALEEAATTYGTGVVGKCLFTGAEIAKVLRALAEGGE